MNINDQLVAGIKLGKIMSVGQAKIISVWNLSFGSKAKRIENLKRQFNHQLRSNPKGKGNRAWKRVEELNKEYGTIIWPEYAMGGNKG